MNRKIIFTWGIHRMNGKKDCVFFCSKRWYHENCMMWRYIKKALIFNGITEVAVRSWPWTRSTVLATQSASVCMRSIANDTTMAFYVVVIIHKCLSHFIRHGVCMSKWWPLSSSSSSLFLKFLSLIKANSIFFYSLAFSRHHLLCAHSVSFHFYFRYLFSRFLFKTEIIYIQCNIRRAS